MKDPEREVINIAWEGDRQLAFARSALRTVVWSQRPEEKRAAIACALGIIDDAAKILAKAVAP